MTISINWATKVITVPKSDTQLVQSTPTEIRQLDLDNFRLTLKDLEDDEEGMPFVRTHNHVAPIEVGGVTLARVVELINDYTVTFEDGQYAVNLVGANSNVGDNVNVNQVSVRSANSAGLTFSETINDQSFLGGRIFIDTERGLSGIDFPRGTPSDPVDNWDDARSIANNRKFFKFQLEGDLNLQIGDDYVDTDWFGNAPIQSQLSLSGEDSSNCVFENMTIDGQVSGPVNIRECTVGSITDFQGDILNCSFTSSLSFDSSATGISQINGCMSAIAGTSRVQLDINSADVAVNIRNWFGGLDIMNFNQGNNMSIDVSSGTVHIKSSCTDGTIVIRGVCELIDESGAGCEVVTTGKVNEIIENGSLGTEVMNNQKLIIATAGNKIIKTSTD